MNSAIKKPIFRYQMCIKNRNSKFENNFLNFMINVKFHLPEIEGPQDHNDSVWMEGPEYDH